MLESAGVYHAGGGVGGAKYFWDHVSVLGLTLKVFGTLTERRFWRGSIRAVTPLNLLIY